MIAALRERLRDRARRSELADRQRAGTFSRRKIQQRQREVLRRHWPYCLGLVAFGALAASATKLVVHPAMADYMVGGIAVGVVWAAMSVLQSLDGMANHRLGLTGEQWTADELRKLRKDGWRVVHHVMLERGDVDHAVIGPGGLLAIDSKYRTDWATGRASLSDLARKSRRQASDLQPRLQVWEPKVKPIVALWGPRVSELFDDVFERDGVTFCVGMSLATHLRSLDHCLDETTVDKAYSHIDDYVARRDIGEESDFGVLARPAIEQMKDVAIAALLTLTIALSIGALTRVDTSGAWATAIAVAIGVMSLVVRRRFRSSERVQRATAATMTASFGLAVLLATALAAQHVR